MSGSFLPPTRRLQDTTPHHKSSQGTSYRATETSTLTLPSISPCIKPATHPPPFPTLRSRLPALAKQPQSTF
ncbi:hypothetical protein E2C01_087168 [Portunus trituberculatus]|uniref:Uncharacterized protein n=1 Tax=Portunus trituberculatus TaxID=210409 RepID=A0A5B7JDC1_PORTR|nr:hypothetical protein [Portunus trituberculatus]